VRDETELEQAGEGSVDAMEIDAEQRDDAHAPIEGRAMAVSGEREEDEDGDGVGSDVVQPPVVQQAVVEPAEAAFGPPQEVGAWG
jgi:hypothetical protein